MLFVASHVLNRLQWLNRPVRQESGQGLIEYGLLGALIALVAIGAGINRRTRSFEVRTPSTRSFAQAFR